MEVQQYYSMSEITISGRNIPKPIIHFAEAAFPGIICAFQHYAVVNTYVSHGYWKITGICLTMLAAGWLVLTADHLQTSGNY